MDIEALEGQVTESKWTKYHAEYFDFVFPICLLKRKLWRTVHRTKQDSSQGFLGCDAM